MSNSEIIRQACLSLNGDDERAKAIIANEYPFKPIVAQRRGLSAIETLEIFIRDGFVDRYFGTRMVYPPVLRVLSYKFPDQFPYHPNWKMDSCHIAYWELVPTLDHVVPIAQGGANTQENIVCTSMLHNSVKSNFMLDQIGWEIKPCGDFNEWDGMLHWYVSYLDDHPDIKGIPYFKRNYNLVLRALENR